MSMKLYFCPGACSFAAHIALQEAGVACDYERVDLKSKKTAGGGDFNAINPKGYVPTLQIDQGVLTENVAVLQYIADLNPQSGLAPARDSFERYRLQEWLAYVNSEVHKSYKPYFDPQANDSEKARAAQKLVQRLDYVEAQLGDKPYLLGQRFTVADAYLYTVLGWLSVASLDIARWPRLQAYQQRIAGRPAVKAAHAAENAA